MLTTGIEATNEVYSSVALDENGKVVHLKAPMSGAIIWDTIGAATGLPLALLPIDWGHALYPLMLQHQWVEAWRQAVLNDCQEKIDCQVDMTFELDRLLRLTTTRQEMIEEVYDKFNDPNTKVPVAIISRYDFTYNDEGEVTQLAYQQSEDRFLLQRSMEQLVYGPEGGLAQYYLADMIKNTRIKWTLNHAERRLTELQRSVGHPKKDSWKKDGRLILNYTDSTHQLSTAEYFNQAGHRQYVLQFIYTYY